MRDQFLTIMQFLRSNARWLAGGLLLTFCSSVGQTFFISLFAAQIRSDFHLSHGSFGALYMAATLGSAVSLIYLGRILDVLPVALLAKWWIALLAAAAILMASAETATALLLSLYLLRLFGQGMLSHTAMVAMGRWFVRERGRAISITTAGHQLGEAVLPILVVSTIAMIDWRLAWLCAAAVLLLMALPVSHICLSRARQPSAENDGLVESGKQWTRQEVLKDLPFWVVCTGVLAPSFIGTSVFFHQVHLAEIKQWPSMVIATSFTVMSITTVVVGLVTGVLIDRYQANTVLPFFLLPLSLGCALLSVGDHAGYMMLFMMLLGCSYGVSSAVFGAIWPENYGTRHLGSIRSVVTAAMVFASALGPGLTGWLIDFGVGFELQLVLMGAYCLLTMLFLFPVSRTLRTRILKQAPSAIV
ncbi:MAG: MFS transporter [Granulosicoccus sp.]|nr:MFS transporter [Granulosicoccus sp.]